MEIIKRKICLEQFKSRIPSLIETVDVLGVDKTKYDGSWGEIPKPVTVLGIEMKYGTMMELYHSVLKIIMSANIREYDESGDKWIKLDYDWRDIINNTYRQVSFVTSIPTNNLNDKKLISLVSPDD